MAVAQCGPLVDHPPPIRSTLNHSPTPAELAELWVEPPDVRSRALFYGVGGVRHAPDPHVRYELLAEKHDFSSFSRGYTVKDPDGRKWSVKLGIEAQPEVVASRLIWAAGYHQPPVYYVEHWELTRDGKVTMQPPARFRPKVRRFKRRGTWSWQQNPFVDTRAYRGLIVLMVMLNNWDMTTANNAIYEMPKERDGVHRWFVVQDVGTSFSRTRGSWRDGARGDLQGFARQGFIESVDAGRVLFDWHGPHGDLLQEIRPDDVHWIADRLATLSPTQWDDALRAVCSATSGMTLAPNPESSGRAACAAIATQTKRIAESPAPSPKS